eukprot:2278040-Pleurochrysis_carterae.AAC.1
MPTKAHARRMDIFRSTVVIRMSCRCTCFGQLAFAIHDDGTCDDIFSCHVWRQMIGPNSSVTERMQVLAVRAIVFSSFDWFLPRFALTWPISAQVIGISS